MTDIHQSIDDTTRDDILNGADMCVACGMCLPHCPTYQLSMQEAESPRGRLSLITAYINGDLQMDAILQQHLDHCLLCRSCEKVCPAQVPFAQIMDNARACMRTAVKSDSWPKKQLLTFVSKRNYARRLVTILSRLRLAKLIRTLSLHKLPGLGRYLRFAIDMQAAPVWQEYYPAQGEQKFSVGLFIGCVDEFFDSKSLLDTIRVLNYLNIGVYVADDQQCCGAMHLHAGERAVADELYQQTVAAFAQYDIKAVVSLSSACTATMVEQTNSGMSRPHKYTNPARAGFTVMDICSFLESINWFEGRKLHGINVQALLHYPCTQRNVLKNAETVNTLIRRIPDLNIQVFDGAVCCGAAGSYALDYPEWSDQISDSVAQAISIEAGVIITTNIGCLLQFRNICNKNDNLEVLHPINLVAKSLGI